MMTAISNYVAQNFGAGSKDRIRQGVRACLIQTEAFNLVMCIGNPSAAPSDRANVSF